MFISIHIVILICILVSILNDFFSSIYEKNLFVDFTCVEIYLKNWFIKKNSQIFSR